MPSGVSCCVYKCSNATHNWKGQKTNNGLRFFRIPRVKTHQGQQMKAVTERRRRAWIAAIRRTNITFEHSSNAMRVCSKHFHTGQPAYEMRENDPDWAPSLHLGHEETKQTDTTRYNRQKARSMLKTTNQQCEEELEIAVEDEGPAMGECTDSGCDSTNTISTQTDITSTDMLALTEEMNKLREENRSLKQSLELKEITLQTFERDDEKVKYYTGLPNFSMFLCLFSLVKVHLPQGNRRAFSPFQMLVITLMRLRLNLPTQHIAYTFGVHRSTVTNTFVDTISVLHERLVGLIHWPDRQCLQASMPHEFVEAFGKNVSVIIDCFEIFIERPSNLKARAQTFSMYKHNHTMKYLIAISPQGAISFISKGWGGRTSDKHITEHSGFLSNLLPGDKILADRGFDIQESVGLMCAEVKIPSFTRGKCQMHAQDIEQTRKLAHLRIHVERVIGNVVMKYQILSSTIPINLVLPCEGEELTFLDKMVVVCCALTNMCPSVV